MFWILFSVHIYSLPTFTWAHWQKFPETKRSVSKWVPESVDLVVMHDDQRVWNNSLVHYALDSVSKIKISSIFEHAWMVELLFPSKFIQQVYNPYTLFYFVIMSVFVSLLQLYINIILHKTLINTMCHPKS